MEEEVKPQEILPQISLSLDDLKSVLTQALAPIQTQISTLSDKVLALEADTLAMDNVPTAGRKGDPSVRWSDQRVARRATIATRAASDNPQDYQHIVDSSTLSQKGGN